MADTSWSDPVPLVETGVPPMIAFATADTPPRANRSQGKSEGSRFISPTNARTATLLDSGAAVVHDHRGQPEQDSWPVSSWPGSEMKIRAATSNLGMYLPTAKDILAAASGRSSPQSRKSPGQLVRDQTTLTVARPPGEWSPPVWLAWWCPAAFLVLVMGVAGTLLSLRWAIDSYNASVVNQRLVAHTASSAKEKPLPESVTPPDPSWWQTTALHLAQWGVYLDRTGSTEDRTEEARDLLEAAVRISPINPTARLARMQLGSQSTALNSLVRNLGLSRDSASLAYERPSSPSCGKEAGRDPDLCAGSSGCLPR